MPIPGWSREILQPKKPQRLETALMNFTCQEWKELPIGERGLSEKEARQFHVYAVRAARRLKTTVLTRTTHGLKAEQVVGILQTPSATLEILPKIDGNGDDAARKALVHMLAETWSLSMTHGELATLSAQHSNLLEYFIRLFSERLLAAVRRGLPRRYLIHTEDLALLRGKLDVVRQLTHLSVRPDRLACHFDELSEKTPLNRVLKAAVSQLRRVTRSPSNAQRLAELSSRFEYVGDTPTPLRELVRIDRTNTTFHGLYHLARFFLSGDWQSTTSGNAVTGFSLLFPMNDLFEEFVGRIMKRALAPLPVHLQHRGKHALISENSRPTFALRPDIVVHDKDGPIILDTKWKHLDPKDTRTLGVSQSDIYQMLAYARAYEAQRLVLIYPWHSELSEPGLHKRWKVPNTDCFLDIVTVDIGQPNTVPSTLSKLFGNG